MSAPPRLVRAEHTVEIRTPTSPDWRPLIAGPLRRPVTGDPQPLLAALRAAYPGCAFRVHTLTYTWKRA